MTRYLRVAARQPRTLTILISDHGLHYGKYNSYEATVEQYNPFLFLVVPEHVQRILGPAMLEALETNQHRLVSHRDLHYLLTALPAIMTDGKVNSDELGLLSPVPLNRSCEDLPLAQGATCICEGAEQPMVNDSGHQIFAEFAIGEFNNRLSRQYTTRFPQASSGFGRCERLVPHQFHTVITAKAQDGTLKIRMIILASVTGAGIKNSPLQEFSVTIGYSPHRSAAIRLEALQRINIYADFLNCAITDGVDQELCACNLKRPFPDFTAIKLISQGKYVNVFGKPSQIRTEIIRESRDKFGKSGRVEIAIIKRNVGHARVVYE
ncbi:PREDICTED: uncharacterized protein LOC106819162, partial [Priapulus caudatus]|uniref:Uncharacterized protein LOC106819162 n=1 Tax=Priapulus caudatus TaxID=37621 RepID=A0ABM1F4D0_PRICU